MSFKFSGKNNIDALLKKQYWNSVGKAVKLTYSITGFNKKTEKRQIELIQEALKQWERVADITFEPVKSKGNIRFSGHDSKNDATSYTKTTGWWIFKKNTNRLSHVDIRLQRSRSLGKGGSFLETALHEIGHALGLKHPGNYNGDDLGIKPFFPYQEDNNTNTIMSYNDVGTKAATPMPYDIRAIQYLYGARSLNSGNTNYQFYNVHSYYDGKTLQGNVVKPLKLAIWDSGGKDTLNFSYLAKRSNGYYIDIKEGGIITLRNSRSLNSNLLDSGVSDSELSKFKLKKDYTPIDNSKKADFLKKNKQWTTTQGTSIAYKTIIENVVGSSSDDFIRGNQSHNVLEGKNGNDILIGGAGNDTLLGGAGNDTVIVKDFNGNDKFEGGADYDTLVFAPSDGRNLKISLTRGTVSDNRRGSQRFKGFEEIRSGRGNDTITGDSHDNILYGGIGNDTIIGGAGNDYLNGTGSTRTAQGKGERDILVSDTRGSDSDTFVLGNKNFIFYNDQFVRDYAIIQNFDYHNFSGEQKIDKIQLHGNSRLYSLGNIAIGNTKGTGIFHRNDLIGLVQNVHSSVLNLSDSSQFTYV